MGLNGKAVVFVTLELTAEEARELETAAAERAKATVWRLGYGHEIEVSVPPEDTRPWEKLARAIRKATR